MIIHKMTACFGRLENETLELRPGLNILEAPNESGKSTWCAFLRCMLYGVDSAQREKAGQKPDKLLYAPWSGRPMAGTVDLTWRGENITLQRTSRLPGAPMREFSACYTGTSETVPGLDSASAGEKLTGVTEEVFRRSAFIQQGNITVLPEAELEKRLTGLITGGDEEMSYGEAFRRLSAWQRKRRWRNKGRLPEIEEEIAFVQKKLDSLQTFSQEQEQLTAASVQADIQRKNAEKQVTEDRFSRREEALIRLDKAQERQKKLEQTAILRRQEAEQRKKALQKSVFEGKNPVQCRAEIERVLEDYRTESSRGNAGQWLAILLCLLGLLTAAAGYFLSDFVMIIGGAVLLAGIAMAVLYAVRACRHKKQMENNQAGLRAYGVRTPDELLELLKKYEQDARSAVAAFRLAEQVQQEAERAAGEQQTIRREVFSALEEEGENAEALRAAEAQLQNLREQQAVLQGRRENYGDPMVLATALRALEAEKSNLEQEYRALELAMEELSAANAQLQAELTPGLAERTAYWMSRLTGGQYTDITMDRNFSAMLRRPEDPVAREAGFLSAGAWNQLYLALRLALCERILPEDDPCPLILDDALISFDDRRLGFALDALEEMAEKRQILLFTCQDRENRYRTSKGRT